MLFEGVFMSSITLTGVFDERRDVLAARDKLLSTGVENSAISFEPDITAETSETITHQQDRRGFFSRLFGLGDDDKSTGNYAEAVRRGSIVLTVQIQDEARITELTELLEDAGAIDIDQRVERWRASGYIGYDASAAPYNADQIAAERSGTLEVVQEDLKVGKREVQRGGVRVHRHITEIPVEELINLREQRAVVERTPVDRPASNADLSTMQDQTIEVRETIEEPVISKTARVVEEVRVGTAVSERTETVRDTVRRSDVDMEQVSDDSAPSSLRYAGQERRIAANSSSYIGPERRVLIR
jgi:uncharacterized protein (TIGR02271 family)